MNMKLNAKLGGKLRIKSLACWFLIASTCPQVLAFFPEASQAQVAVNKSEAIAVASRITDINSSVSGDRFNLTLSFASSDRPQVTYARQGKDWIAVLNGAQLQLGSGNASYTKSNPAPGITAIEATPYETNKVRIRVTAASPEVLKDLIKRQDTSNTLVFSLEMQTNSISSADAPESGVIKSTNNSPSLGKPLFEPKVTITAPDGTTRVAQSNAPNSTPPSATSPVTPQLQGRVPGIAPPFRPLKTPPVGDIATSTSRLRSDIVDLGSAERVPRITLRNAPAIEVLTLIGRVAGLSIVSADAAPSAAAGATPTAGATSISQPVSLTIENETAQDVFNNVLRITGLEANRIGNTIFVATKLPVTLKNLITKSYRLNQITAGEASAYLIGLGASRVVNRQRAIPGVQTATIGTAAAAVVNVSTETVPTLETVAITAESGATPLLKGVQVVAEERGNSVTLIGSPRQVEFAEAQLARLDIRKRQISVNVRIVDVQLLNNQSFSSQFSFGVGDSFYTVRDGVAVANFGQYTPAPSASNAGSLTSVPTVSNPFGSAQSFIDFTSSTTVPQTIPGRNTFIDGVLSTNPLQTYPTSAGEVFNRLPISSTTGNPFQSRITGYTPSTPDVITVTNTPAVFDPVTGALVTPAKTTTTTALGTIGSAVQSLSSLFQYPTQFLQGLQFQVQSGNAKVLTDPTLTVQEGESASVGLTQDVPAGSTVETTTVGGVATTGRRFTTQKAGLTLNIVLERVDDNGFVNMSISPKVSAPIQTITNPDGSQQALLSERTLNSGRIRLRDGQTLILSGVIQDTDKETITKVPFFGDLPIIGALFRGSNSQNTRSEVIIIVTPRIMDDSQNSNFGYTYQPGAQVQKVLDSNQIKTP
jgi:type IV pilus assembly protein PilQ